MKIVYIAGYGRSGSTLLERVLSANSKLFGTGSLWSIWDLETPSVTSREGDAFWERVLGRLYVDLPVGDPKAVQMDVERATRFWRALGSEGERLRRDYRRVIDHLFDTLDRHVPEFIVDSSKTQLNTFFRPVALQNFTDHEVYVIHLVRDGRGCLWSNLKGSNEQFGKGLAPPKRLTGLRTMVSWYLSNGGAHLFDALVQRDRYVQVHYEDFCQRPRSALEQIEPLIGVDLDEQIAMLEAKQPIPRAKQIAGNRLRHSEELVLEFDAEWQEKLDGFHRGLFWALGGPLAAHYGYRPGGARSV
ncbi:MAG: sulfotransferase [Bradymonadaceae bacterium]